MTSYDSNNHKVSNTTSSGTSIIKSKSSFRCVYTNADCLTNKLTALQECIDLNNPDIVAITEIKPKNSTLPLSPTTFNVDNYQFFHNIDAEGRGIGIYTHNSLRALETKVDSTFHDYVCIEIKLFRKDYLKLVCCYRSPSLDHSSNDTFIKDFPIVAGSSTSHLLVLADFNLKSINWEENATYEAETHVASRFLEVTQGHTCSCINM